MVPGLGGEASRVIFKGYGKESGQVPLCGPEDSEASLLWDPHSFPHGEAPGRAETKIP